MYVHDITKKRFEPCLLTTLIECILLVSYLNTVVENISRRRSGFAEMITEGSEWHKFGQNQRFFQADSNKPNDILMPNSSTQSTGGTKRPKQSLSRGIIVQCQLQNERNNTDNGLSACSYINVFAKRKK